MQLELEPGGVQCQISLESDFIGIYSSLVLNDLLNISVEIAPGPLPYLEPLDSLQSWQFSQSHVHSKTDWFQGNLDEIMGHLKVNFLAGKDTRTRNLVVQGLRGSGKTTLLKFVCNRVVEEWNGAFWYVNCQGFVNKTVETIHEQLRLVYEECVWAGPRPCLVVLEDMDLLIENKEQTVDPSSQLYHAQIVECKLLEKSGF